MTMISNTIKHYQFSSGLRTYSLVKTPIRYLKTAKNVSPDVPASCRHMRGGKRNTINSIAACARKQGASGLFDRVKPQKSSCFEGGKLIALNVQPHFDLNIN
jgi:hypothetical protein